MTGRHDVGAMPVVRTLAEFDQVKEGEILICRMTNPAWVVLFTKIVGLVTDAGGVTSHPAVVSREFGIPAVVGVHGATEYIERPIEDQNLISILTGLVKANGGGDVADIGEKTVQFDRDSRSCNPRGHRAIRGPFPGRCQGILLPHGAGCVGVGSRHRRLGWRARVHPGGLLRSRRPDRGGADGRPAARRYLRAG